MNSEISSLESFPIQINITNDNIEEPDECFVCRITAVDGLPCAAIGNNNETEICIKKFCVSPGNTFAELMNDNNSYYELPSELVYYAMSYRISVLDM